MEKKLSWQAVLAILLTIAAVTVLLRLHSLGEPFERDLTSHGYIAHQMLAGDELYTDVWNHKPPGIYWVYMLSELLWGYEPSAIVNIGILFTLITLIFLYLFLKEVAGVKTALAGSAFWALASNSVLLQANLPNTELFINCFTVIALWSFVKYRQGKRGFLFLSGLSLALASVIKTIVVFPFLAVCLYFILPFPKVDAVDWLKDNLKKLSVFLTPGFLVWGAIFSYFAVTGRFGDFREAVFDYNLYYSGDIVQNVRDFFTRLPDSILLFIDTGGLVILSLLWLPFGRKTYGPLGRGFFILFFLGTVVAVACPGKHWPHYFQLFLPVITILSALFLSDVRARWGGRWPRATPGLVGVIFLFAFSPMLYFQASYLKMTPEEISRIKYTNVFVESYEVAGVVKSLTSPCETVYEWGAETGIYYYSQRKAASGIFFVFPLLVDWEVAVTTASQEMRARKTRRVFEDITGSPPAIFLWNRSYGRLEESMFSDFIKKNYNIIGKSGNIFGYEYKYRKEYSGDDGCQENNS